MAELLLGVNIDHIATLRNARGTDYPDPVQAANRKARTALPYTCAKIVATLPIAMCAFCVRRCIRV